VNKVTATLPSREQAINLLQKNNCPPKVINHCIAVTDFAIQIARKLQDRGYVIDLGLVEAGGLLHDLGRSKTHAVDHSLVGAQIAETLRLPQAVINIIKRHVGAGITEEEAEWLGWPKDNYIPQTIEEKVVCYADKRIDHDKVIPIQVEIEQLQRGGFGEAAERVRRLHDEITQLLGETP
jgi:uncharacterized protein